MTVFWASFLPQPCRRRSTLPALAIGLLALAAGVAGGAAVSFTAIVTGLSAPTAFVDPPDKLGHRFIAQRRGDIRVWDGSSTSALATPLLDLRDLAKVNAASGEQGLLAMTVHPDYLANGYLYVFYTATDWDGPGGIATNDVVIERYTRSAGNPNQLDPASGQVVMVIGHALGTNHNGGDLEFGPDGYLYISVGDGGGSCDNVYGSGQDLDQLLGKLLRIDVDGDDFPGDPLRNYAIPPDNPLAGLAGADEIWALGLRNPFRFSFDRLTGDIYLGDVGQNDWEEVNLLPVGAVSAGNPINFGWPCREGFDEAGCGASAALCNGKTFAEPIRQEANVNQGGNWRSVMGGYLYRGYEVTTDLAGRYVYGDALNSQVWLASPRTGGPWPTVQIGSGQAPYGFAEDQHGELYVVSNTGSIRCLHDGSGCPWQLDEGRVFRDDFESGTTLPWRSP
jgi:glucose/arabinose dehydrogenase